ncbi:uncharacterized protein LOC143611825 [Bidens hawaiensis]|uniref:uncharacterized protein LOC143611825 n=1 Tax=Bidens hawaiensis TaxID=980011 RepID=UPI00404A513C
MRLERPDITPEEQHMISAFSSWLLSIGDGDVGTPDINDHQNSKYIHIPTQYCIPYSDTALTELIRFIYDDETLYNPTTTTLSKKAIVCPKNDMVHEINSILINMTLGTINQYTSIYSIVPQPGDNGDTEILYPSEYLNLLNFNGLPPHVLEPKANLLANEYTYPKSVLPLKTKIFLLK